MQDPKVQNLAREIGEYFRPIVFSNDRTIAAILAHDRYNPDHENSTLFWLVLGGSAEARYYSCTAEGDDEFNNIRAHGETLMQDIHSPQQLRRSGFEHVAIGGFWFHCADHIEEARKSCLQNLESMPEANLQRLLQQLFANHHVIPSPRPTRAIKLGYYAAAGEAFKRLQKHGDFNPDRVDVLMRNDYPQHDPIILNRWIERIKACRRN